MTDPIAFGNNVYAITSTGNLVCVDQATGKKVWQLSVAKQPDGASFSGGMTANDAVIYAATNIGDVLAIDARTQKTLWKKSLKIPLRGAPLYAHGRILVNAATALATVYCSLVNVQCAIAGIAV